MPLHRRELLRFAGAGAAALAAPPRQSAAAENYPTRPVRIIEGLGGGSTPNLVSRLIGMHLPGPRAVLLRMDLAFHDPCYAPCTVVLQARVRHRGASANGRVALADSG